MNISDAVSMSANGKGVQGEVQINLLQQAQDIQAEGVKTMIDSLKNVTDGKGGLLDKTA